MKIFLSWSGEPSRQIAAELRTWLPFVVPGLRPWLSHEDIPKGARWSATLGRELEDTHFGIVCVTPANQDSEWLHYEAGALGKFIDRSHVAPVLFGLELEDLSGPLTQYQLTVFEQRDMNRLIDTLAAAVGSSPSAPAAPFFNLWWPKLERAVSPLIAQYRVAKLQRLGLIEPDEDGESWYLTEEGLQVVVEENLLDH